VKCKTGLVRMPRNQHTREYFRRAIEDEITLHCKEAVIGRPVPRSLHTLNQVSKRLRWYRIVDHHNAIIRPGRLGHNRQSSLNDPENHLINEVMTAFRWR
jgi:hypothetical protein